jgi:small subunit ribosomal protein S17e
MGNIRQTYIKSTADTLLRQYPNEFTKDFNENKDKVDRLATIQTKNVRNHIAGYVTTRMTAKGRKRY